MERNSSSTTSMDVGLLLNDLHDGSGSSGDETDRQTNVFVTLCQALNIFLMCMTIYVFACMIAYGKKRRKWSAASDGTNLDGGKIYIACVTTVAWCFPRLIISQILFHVNSIPGASENCEMILDMGVVAFYIDLWQVYFFLWLRHRAIYAHPTVKSLMGRYSNTVSWILLIGLSVISAVVLCGFTIPVAYSPSKNGCIITPDSKQIDEFGAWAHNANFVVGGFLILSQVSFLALFIYPMIVTKRIRRSQSQPSTPKSRRRIQRMDNITSTIYRSIISATITISSDMMAAVLAAMAIPKSVPRSITFTVYDMSLLINIICIMASFGNNRGILSVFCRGKDAVSKRERVSHTDERHTIGTICEDV